MGLTKTVPGKPTQSPTWPSSTINLAHIVISVFSMFLPEICVNPLEMVTYLLVYL